MVKVRRRVCRVQGGQATTGRFTMMFPFNTRLTAVAGGQMSYFSCALCPRAVLLLFKDKLHKKRNRQNVLLRTGINRC